MKIFNLPTHDTFDLGQINFKFINKEENNDIFISNTISNYVSSTKEKIDTNINDWDSYKKYTNQYEFIHTNISSVKSSISKIKPISRAFYKLIEMYDIINLTKDGKINTFHLAEGPGGFIEATAYYRNNPNDNYYGITLIDNTKPDIPGWTKGAQVIKKYPNIKILRGADNTGNLFTPENLKFCYKNYCNSMNVITADGGFDFSIDFNKQEELAIRLILTEAIYAIILQKKGGVFILKIFDTFLKGTVDILYLLSCFYNNVIVVKPNTSRPANSEKYLICYDFKYEKTDDLIDTFYEILVLLEKNNTKKIKSILNIEYNYNFIKFIENFNAIFASNQIDNILSTVRFIHNKEKKNEKIQDIKNKNINKCINWCKNHNIPYNTANYFQEEHNNIFLSN
jgi:23S rRNA U2552 (ribose-2'-O)-methylase RlmE/FtsJ